MNIAADIYVGCGIVNADIGLAYDCGIYAANIYIINSLISIIIISIIAISNSIIISIIISMSAWTIYLRRSDA
jgi:hypothetical protein